MGLEFLKRAPADQVELDHFPCAFGRLAARPQRHQETGDQGHIALDRYSIGIQGQQMPAAQDALEPAEKQLHRPAIAVGQSDQFRIQVEAVGKQPQFLDATVGTGSTHDYQTQLVEKRSRAVQGAQPEQFEVAHHARRSGCVRQGAFAGKAVANVVLDPDNERRADSENSLEKLVAGVAAIQHVQAVRAQRRLQLLGFGAIALREGGIARDALEDVEVQMEFGSAVVCVHPQGPKHLGQSGQEGAIDGGQITQRLSFGPVFEGQRPLRQLLHDRPQRRGVENAAGLAQRAKRGALDAEEFFNLGQAAGLLQAAQAGDNGAEEVEQQQAGVLVEEQLAVASLVACCADVLQAHQQFLEQREVFQTVQVARLQFGTPLARHGNHSLNRGQASSDSRITSCARAKSHQILENSQILREFRMPKKCAEQYCCAPPCEISSVAV